VVKNVGNIINVQANPYPYFALKLKLAQPFGKSFFAEILAICSIAHHNPMLSKTFGKIFLLKFFHNSESLKKSNFAFFKKAEQLVKRAF
jgi:hypothetical protein